MKHRDMRTYADPGDQTLTTQDSTDPAQAGLFDAVASAEARDSAIEQVDAHAEPEWKHAAYRAVEHACRFKREFTTDDVWRLLQYTKHGTHEPRAMGAIMRKAAVAGLCRKTDRVVESVRVACHRRPVAVWESLT